ncbi:uncharacterized protein LOC121048261 [Ixodes scapularis]|uniref:uncharacterized protein LOC121048261 n=1 Tax=Ixodes scapularis TaxID=6945 RepID=UPI001C3822DE|nr:uncharacterized protein LOC121048261 [Ixodes scapularis]
MKHLGIYFLSILALVAFATAAPMTHNHEGVDGRVDKEAEFAGPMSFKHDAVEGRVETEEGRADNAGFIESIVSFFKSLALAPITVPLEIFNFIIQRIPVIGRFFRPG